jgi:hypothetical protein
MKKHKVVCVDCKKTFIGYSQAHAKRCKQCQEKAQYNKQRRYWKASERSFGDANQTYYAMAKGLTRDELAALYEINKIKLKRENDYLKTKQIKTCMKICMELHRQKSQSDFSEMIEGQAEDYERKVLIEQVGVPDD